MNVSEQRVGNQAGIGQFERDGIFADGATERTGSGGGVRRCFVEPLQCSAQLAPRLVVGIYSDSQNGGAYGQNGGNCQTFRFHTQPPYFPIFWSCNQDSTNSCE